jgi:hypothetical protein
MRLCFIVERVDRRDGMPRLVAERLLADAGVPTTVSEGPAVAAGWARVSA